MQTKPKVSVREFVEWLSRMRADVYEMSYRCDGGSMQLRNIYQKLWELEMDFRGVMRMTGLSPSEWANHEQEIQNAYEHAERDRMIDGTVKKAEPRSLDTGNRGMAFLGY